MSQHSRISTPARSFTQRRAHYLSQTGKGIALPPEKRSTQHNTFSPSTTAPPPSSLMIPRQDSARITHPGSATAFLEEQHEP